MKSLISRVPSESTNHPVATERAPLQDLFTPIRFAALLGLLVLAMFPQVLAGLQTFVVRDYGFFAYPLAHFQRECFWRGELPLWNPYNNCGVPFLAQWNTMSLYPPALIYLIAPLGWSLSFFCLLHVWFGGLGAYFLARRWTGNHFAAAFAGVAFAFNGMTLNLLMWPSHIATFAWMPWVVLLVERGWREGGRMVFIAALAGAMQMLGGGPETVLFTWLLLTVLWVMDILRNGTGERVRYFARFPFMVLMVAALAAAQLLPFLDLAAHSQRETGFADARWSLPNRGWANFLVPMAFGQLTKFGVFFQPEQGWTSSYYPGVAALLLALGALPGRRDPKVWLLGLIAAGTFLCAFGEHTVVYRGLRQLIPALSLMTYPVKYLLLLTLIVPLLAAFALAGCNLNGDPEAKSAPIRGKILIISAVFLLLIGIIVIWAWREPASAENGRLTLVNGIVRAAFLIASTALIVTMTRITKPAFRRFAPVILILLAWLDVFTHEPPQNPLVTPSVYHPGLARIKLAMQPQPLLGESRAMVSPAADKEFRSFASSQPANNFLVKRLGYFANCNLLDEVPKVNGFFSIYPREYGELNARLYGYTNAHFPRLLDFMGVSQMSAPESFFEWVARTNFLPLLTGGQSPVFLDDTNTLRALLGRNFDGRKVVFLPPETKSLVDITNETPVRLQGWRFANQQVDVEVSAEAPALVVVAQTWYHRWRAYVDEQPVPLLRANYAFQAVRVPAGRHIVRLVYEDRPFQIGALISAITTLLCAAGCAWRKSPRATT